MFCVLLTNPLKLDGAEPPLKAFKLDHCAPQNVILVPTVAFWSPITNDPCASSVIDKTLRVVDPLLPACVESPP